MTVNEAINKVNKLKSHAYDEEEIKGFIEECDKRIYRELVERHEHDDIKSYEERYPLSGNDVLIADDAYCMFYVWYAICQIDLFNGEYDRYTNELILYNSYYSDFENYYCRTHESNGTITRIITD